MRILTILARNVNGLLKSRTDPSPVTPAAQSSSERALYKPNELACRFAVELGGEVSLRVARFETAFVVCCAVLRGRPFTCRPLHSIVS